MNNKEGILSIALSVIVKKKQGTKYTGGFSILFLFALMAMLSACSKQTVSGNSERARTGQVMSVLRPVAPAVQVTDNVQAQPVEPAPVVTPPPTPAAADCGPCTNKGYFDYDSSNVRPDAEAVLRQFGTWMIQHGESTLTVEGHADERGTREYNLALAARRAEAAKKYLIAMGVDGGRIKTISYGKERPDDPRSNQDAWARNRRFVALQIDQ